MNRRQFAKTLGLCAVALKMRGIASPVGHEAPQVAMTMDDFDWMDTRFMPAEDRNRRLLETLSGHRNLKLALFVKGKNADNETGRQLLRKWDEEGHIIANHSYSHLEYNSSRVSFETYSQDILRGEAVVKDYAHFRKLFRFPFLKEGNTVAKRDSLRAFLKEHGYRVGHVTIDASDWYVDGRLSARLAKNPAADVKPYRDFYLNHLWERATYYENLAREVLKREVRHTLLLHYNLLNALFLGNVLEMFERKGWKLINAEEAYQDPVFNAAPNIIPAGESLIWALAKETGKYDKLLRYPGEDGEYEKAKMDKLGL